MINLYRLIEFAHVIFAMAWFGGLLVSEVLSFNAQVKNKKEEWLNYFQTVDFLSPRLFAPAGMGTILTGVTAVAIGRPEFTQFWVYIALVLVFITGALGGGVLGPAAKRAKELLPKKSLNDKEVQKLLKRIEFVSILDLALFIIIIFDMVIKPTEINSLFSYIAGVFFLISLLFSVYRYKSE